MSTFMSQRRVYTASLGVAAAATLIFACQAVRPKPANLATGDAAGRVYVAPGQSISSDGTVEGPPPINPLVLPQTTFEDELELTVGRTRLTVRHVQIHSRDAAVVLLDGGDRVLAGDTLEDTITYVSEPHQIELHLAELDRMRSWGAARFLPCHGDPGRIASGGYEPTLIDATSRYTRGLLAARDDAAAAELDLRKFMRPELEAGWITYLPAYEAVHRENLAAVGAM